MKTQIEKAPIFKEVEVGKKDVTVYIAEDGTKFYTAKECSDYEEQAERQNLYDNIEKRGKSLFYPATQWFYASNEKELRYILQVFGANSTYDYVHIYGEPTVGSWIGGHYEDGGDHRGDYWIYTLDHVKKDIKEFLNDFPTRPDK